MGAQAIRFAGQAATDVEVRRAAFVGARAVLVIWLAGVAHATELLSLPLLDLDREGTIPTAFSGALLLWAATAAFVAAARGAPARRSLRALGVLFSFMALDELLRVHETTDSLLGFDWQALYLPLAVVALVAWTGVLRALENRTAEVAWIAAAGCWALSQALELFQWEGRLRPGSIDGAQPFEEVARELEQSAYIAKMLPEELLELSGSLLFSLVLLHVARRAASGRSGRAGYAARPTGNVKETGAQRRGCQSGRPS